MAVTSGKPIDAKYLLEQLKNFNTKILMETYNVKFQFAVMPAASADLKDQYVQYIGATDATYTSGFFYKCVEETDAEAGTTSYKWVAVSQAAPEYEIKKLDNAETGYAATYQLERNGVKAGDYINIPKDYFVRDVTIDKVTEADKQEGGKFADKTDFAVGDTYMDLTINIDNPGETDAKHVYVNISSLIDVYTAGDGIAVADNKISVSLLSTEKGMGLVAEDGAAPTDPKKLALVFETVNIDFENDWK